MPGALDGVTVIELAGLGPVPFAGMMLADHGARVIRIARRAGGGLAAVLDDCDVLGRNREVVHLNLKDPGGIVRLRALINTADAFIEGFRPGVLERLGLAPEVLLADNPRLVIGRMTGWGQDGPLAARAGHDINYIALSGALHMYGLGKPAAPVNVVGDFGGGGMMLAFGVLAGILSARATGQGQVIDCAMSEGAALLSAMQYGLHGGGRWVDDRQSNQIDGAAHYYDTYQTADGLWIAVGALEPQFYAMLIDRMGLAGDPDFAGQGSRADWPRLSERLAGVFRTRTRAEWSALLEGCDACFAPVLSLAEAPLHPHNQAREAFVTAGGIVQPAPVPRFSRTPAPPVRMGEGRTP